MEVSQLALAANADGRHEVKEMPVADVKFRDDLYPRIQTDYKTVQRYAENLEVLPPIEVNQHSELIDGWHRWTAHKTASAVTIKCTVTETKSDAHLLELAITRNATHGLQLSQDDKREMAHRIYLATPERERDEKKAALARILSVAPRTVRDWLHDIDRKAIEKRNRQIFDLWMACWTEEAIAAEVGASQDVVSDVVLRQTATLPESVKPHASHLVDFTAPLYNVWTWAKKSEGATHFGNSEPTIVDNLLYLYTQPFDVVIDPFAGGGSTIDVCKKRCRRYWVSDRAPIPAREKDIRRWDMTEGLPPLPRWQNVRLVYLDPPYWKQAEGEYSKDAADLANMPLDTFTDTLAGVIKAFGKKLSPGAVIALLMQPTQWRAEGRQYTDHVADMIKAVQLPLTMRVQCPYSTEQCTPQMVEWAKANKTLLVLSRELVLWRVPEGK